MMRRLGATLLMAAVGSALISAAPAPKKPSRSIEAVLDLETGAWLKGPAPDLDRPYPAGSLFKLVTALQALQSGVSSHARHTCTGSSCWYKPGHGRLSLKDALAHSCSSYFADLSIRLDPRAVVDMATRLGFEPGGRLDTPLAFAGDHPTLRIRPTRAALLMGYLATGRMATAAPVGETERLEVRQALVEAATLGTSSELLENVPRAAAKTGTSYNEGRLFGWCAGFSPDLAPRYAFAVLVEGATAREGAVPAAALLLKALRWSPSCSRPRD